ncbi:MAG: NAD(P)/FAD-dependent oxidoreductase [Planctomycetota bacterium]
MDASFDVAIAGAGPAGLMAAIRAARRDCRILLLDRSPRPGAKVLASGGGRCNVTHKGGPADIASRFPKATGRFLRPALATFPPAALRAFLALEGVETLVEEGGKVFPASGRASDVLEALRRALGRTACAMAFGQPVLDVARLPSGYRIRTDRRDFEAARVVVATGGPAYPALGATADGWRIAAGLGHDVLPPRPALAPVTSNAPWVHLLQGISVADASVRLVEVPGTGAKGNPPAKPRNGDAPARALVLAESRGGLLFAHFGPSGPAILDVSREVSAHPNPEALVLECDLLPGLSETELDERLRLEALERGRRTISGLLENLLPRRLRETIISLAGLANDRRASAIPRTERRAYARALKRLEIPVSGTLGFDRAEVAAGGVALGEVNPRTMESRLVPGLFFAGELLDIDGPVGGFNLQAAFSTGFLAGQSAAADPAARARTR